MNQCCKYYNSPRWSGEILDCSLPMSFDTYNKCSYGCFYCFSFYQKSHTLGGRKARGSSGDYNSGVKLAWVDVKKIRNMFSGKSKDKASQQFWCFIKDKKVMQWGALADPFDEHERRHGVSLNLLKFFKSIDYPLCFSTKGAWWVWDERYRNVVRGQDNWNCKWTIINLDPELSAAMEKGCPSPEERLKAGKEYTRLNKGGFTLRLRPFIVGLSDRRNEYLELIKLAHEHGADAVSTEFFCLEARADERLQKRYKRMSDICGMDVVEFYKKHSPYAFGYLRLNYELKKPYFEKMESLCNKLGMRFYVSDAHHKERCHNGSCCGLPEGWNYSRGQFTEALMMAKKNGRVVFSDINKYMGFLKQKIAIQSNNATIGKRIKYAHYTMYDYMRSIWNTPNDAKSPYKCFNGVMHPVGLDDLGDVIYEYRGA